VKDCPMPPDVAGRQRLPEWGLQDRICAALEAARRPGQLFQKKYGSGLAAAVAVRKIIRKTRRHVWRRRAVELFPDIATRATTCTAPPAPRATSGSWRGRSFQPGHWAWYRLVMAPETSRNIPQPPDANVRFFVAPEMPGAPTGLVVWWRV